MLRKKFFLKFKEFQLKSNLPTTIIHLSYLAIPTPGGGSFPISRSLLTNNPPSPGKVGYTTRVYVFYCFWTVVWVLLCPTRIRQEKRSETRPTVFQLYPRRLKSLNICRCLYKGSTFSSVTSEDPECWSDLGLTPRPSTQQTRALPTELSRRW